MKLGEEGGRRTRCTSPFLLSPMHTHASLESARYPPPDWGACPFNIFPQLEVSVLSAHLCSATRPSIVCTRPLFFFLISAVISCSPTTHPTLASINQCRQQLGRVYSYMIAISHHGQAVRRGTGEPCRRYATRLRPGCCRARFPPSPGARASGQRRRCQGQDRAEQGGDASSRARKGRPCLSFSPLCFSSQATPRQQGLFRP